MAERGTRRRDETRARLVAAAAEVFAEQGITASTIEQVCERAGYSRGAFYSNFESKIAICEELLVIERGFYADAFRRGAAAFTRYFAAHPELLALGPYEILERGLVPLLGAFVAVEDDERAATPTNLSLLYTELGLYAAREPGIRPAYAPYAEGMSEPFEQLLGPLFALAGLRLTVSGTEAAELITALYEEATRDALMSETAEGVVAAVIPGLLLAIRLVTEPLPGRGGTS